MLTSDMSRYAEGVREELLDFIRALAPIPAPSRHEDRRVAFLADALPKLGIKGAFADDAKNVVIPFGGGDDDDVVVAMAHTDVVFPDEAPLPCSEDDATLRGPGIGDDTARLAQLLVAARYFSVRGMRPARRVVFVANACEEGLGNLAGCRAVCKAYAGRIRAFVSVDNNAGGAVNVAVGSHRYRVSVATPGGHSWSAFGKRNAIAEAAGLIDDLYHQRVPVEDGARTTYNVGLVSGGTSVNTIAQDASFLYEYRSTSRNCLAEMKAAFEALVNARRRGDVTITVETVGERPCSGDVPRDAQAALEAMADRANRAVYGSPLRFSSGSTDANIPLSLGIPALTIGSTAAHGAHTRGEWLEKDSLVPGLAFLIAFLSDFCQMK